MASATKNGSNKSVAFPSSSTTPSAGVNKQSLSSDHKLSKSELDYYGSQLDEEEDCNLSNQDNESPKPSLSNISNNPHRRCDETSYNAVKRLTESNAFNWFIIITICLNAICMGVETDKDLRNRFSGLFEGLDNFFLSIYSVEFCLKIYAEPKYYWHSAYNVFDFIVLTISYVQILINAFSSEESDSLEAIRVLRALRTLRTLRTVSFFRGLQVLVIALVDTIRKWVINIILLLLLLMFLFAIMGYYFFGYRDDGDKLHWGHLGKAMLTLFSYVTVDGWTDFQNRLDRIDIGMSRIYTITFIFLGHFIFSNVFIGVIIMNISEATENYKLEQIREKEAVLKQKKESMMMKQHADVRRMIERQKRGHYANFNDMVEEFQKGLQHTESVVVTDLCTNVIWIETFLRTLDHMDETLGRLQQLHFETANTLTHHMEDKLKAKYGT